MTNHDRPAGLLLSRIKPINGEWASPFSFLKETGFFFFFFFYENSLSKQNSPRWEAAASHLGLCCLHMSHKIDELKGSTRAIFLFQNLSLT